MKDRRTTNILLLIIVIPLILFLMKVLSFIFVPLVGSMFIALLFLPIMRWLKKKRVPKPISLLLVIIILLGGLKIGIELIQLTTKEITAADSLFFENAEKKVLAVIENVENSFGIEREKGDNIFLHYLQDLNIFDNFGTTLDFIGSTLSVILMTLFFVILLLYESINIQVLMNKILFNAKYSSIRAFASIEKEIIKFVGVKFIISLLTGVGFSLACLYFDVSFPIFWGLFAFLINFVQMVGSIISVVLLSLFGLVDLDPTGTLLVFILTITLIQAIFGGVLEPILMGKTFSINVVTVLVMLMLWGYLWGIPGLIMSIPITVFIKIILSQFPKTRTIADLMSGSPTKIAPAIREKLRRLPKV